MSEEKRPLKVFLSYASQDKPVVRELSRRLVREGWINPWVDEKKLLPGQDWRLKIEEAVETSDIVIICLSGRSVSKEGYVQKELRYAREIALEKPEETIFLIPLRLEECDVPRGLRFFQWVDYFGEKKDEAYKALIESLKLRYEQVLRNEEAERARQEKEKREREAIEIAAREKAERESIEEAARERAEREAAEKIAREKAEREAAEKALREKKEKEAAERAAREKAEKEAAEQAEREAAEKAARERAEKESAERAAREKAKKEAAKKAAREKAEREAAEKTAREQARRLAVEKVKRERAERQAVRKMVLLGTFSRDIDGLKATTLKLIPFFRIIGILGIIALLFWGGSLVMPKFFDSMPTVKPSRTLELTATRLIMEIPPSVTATNVPEFTATFTETSTLTPTATPIEITDDSGVEMILIPAGEFIMGYDEIQNTKPAHRVYLDAYFLDKYEVTNALYKTCVDANACSPPIHEGDGYDNPNIIFAQYKGRESYYGNDEYGNYPVMSVTWRMANIFCKWRGARLPTEAEWEKGARGTDENYLPNYVQRNQIYSTTKVGLYETNKSPYGIYDMVGNVAEFVADWYQADYFQTLSDLVKNPSGPSSGDGHVVRNGIVTRYNAASSDAQPTLGFRCAKDATP